MAEKQESLLFVIIGSAAIVLSVIFFFFIKSTPSFYKGAAIPLFTIGLLMGVVGYTVYARSDKQRLSVAYEMGLNPGVYINNQELPRMKKVMKNFVIYRYIEIILALAGVALFFFFRSQSEKQFLTGLGLALTIMAIMALTADYFAEKRGSVYTKELENSTTAK
jgi:drug/metabolite transporter (DMT)-like permease